MLRVTIFAATVALALAAPSPNPVNIFKIDITPEEAQQYLNSPPFTDPQLSGRTNVLPLVRYDSPQFRTAEAGPTLGHYWKNGHEIENTDDYVEEVYDASQFHGQDGLGAYAYGYRAPESSKVENRARSGDVQGSYTYKDGNNNDIKVRYWADSEGFHQEDNLPKVELQPVQETEEVRQARLAHEKAWQEAADAALHPNAQPQQQPQQQYQGGYSQYQSASAPQPAYQSASSPQPAYQSASSPQATYQAASSPQPAYQPYSQPQPQETYQPLGQHNYQSAASEKQQVTVAAPENQVQQREGKAFASSQANYQQPQQYNQAQQYNQQPQPQPQKYGQQQGAFSQQSSQYSQAQAKAQYGQQQPPQGQYGQQQQDGQYQPDEAEPTGPPRGFFYSFDYPVSIIVRKDAQGQNGPVNPGTPVDHDTVGVNSPHYG